MSMERDPYEVLLEALISGDPSAAIINQEKRGQGDLVHNDVLPIDMGNVTREQVEQLGFAFDDVVDDLFIAVTLPQGWKKVPTEHSMWTDLVDDAGVIRGSIFYKAAFYDRSAHMHWNSRYNYSEQPVGGWGGDDYHGKPFESVVRDGAVVIWRSNPAEYDDHKMRNDNTDSAKAWLEEHFPDWRSPFAYR